jgi:hypothetical protein
MNDLFEQLRSPDPIEDFIYHYTKTNIVLEKILPSMTLRLSSFNTANDPLEFSEFYSLGGGMGEKNYNEEAILFARKDKRINTILKNGIKYASFCRDNEIKDGNGLFNKGFARSRMWAQYSEKHQGVSLIFSKSKLLENLANESIKYNGAIIFEGNVSYDNDLSELREALYINMDSLDDDIDRIMKYKNAFLLTKNMDFENELEYRIALYHKSFESDNSIDISIKDALIGIVIGVQCHKVYNSIFNEFSIKNGYGIFSLYWRNGQPILLKDHS